MKTVIDYNGEERDIKAFQHSLQEWPSYASKHLSDEGEAFLGNVVEQEVDGATVEGNGTLQFPLRAKLTTVQKAAPMLLEAVNLLILELKNCKSILKAQTSFEYNEFAIKAGERAIKKASEKTLVS